MQQVDIQLFVDLDGVLADFVSKVKELTGINSTGRVPPWYYLADIRMEGGGKRHTLLSKLASHSQSAEDLGFIKSQPAHIKEHRIKLQVLNRLLKQEFIQAEKQEQMFSADVYSLTDLGKEVLTEVADYGVYTKGPDVYNSLDKMPDADILWDHVKQYDPIILTGKPTGNWAEPQKRAWVARVLGPDVPVIVCMAKDKAEKAAEYLGYKNGKLHGAILIDDLTEGSKPQFAKTWRNAGGEFILHTSAENSVALLTGLLSK